MKPIRSAALTGALVATTGLLGCGTTPNAAVSANAGGTVSAQSSAVLRQGFEDVHKAIFGVMDSNADGNIDEYEAGPFFNLRTEFPRADKSKAGIINYNEFMTYATKGGFLGINDTPERFLERERRNLDRAFRVLDVAPKKGWFEYGDGYLSSSEVARKAVTNLGLSYSYPKLHVEVRVKGFRRADFQAADKTGDRRLSQGEFEDLYIKSVIDLIGKLAKRPGGGTPAPAPMPGDPGTAPADPGAPPAMPPMPSLKVVDSDAWAIWGDLL
ncbi:MAG: hypothetical protein VKO21_09370 [Candidatus Sericytochromatia bacterium]|nr:hypothetical protein [Candidatus Sericytochromatia bacterium]